jgi:hypothetical protein
MRKRDRDGKRATSGRLLAVLLLETAELSLLGRSETVAHTSTGAVSNGSCLSYAASPPRLQVTSAHLSSLPSSLSTLL